MDESILTSIKESLGIIEEYEHFDGQLIMLINSAFNILWQLGVGPTEGFAIVDKESKWEEFLTNGVPLNMAKEYVKLKVQLWFDQTLSGPVISAIERQISELEWRINVTVDPITIFAT